jgi:signal transduction histidine kinase
MSRQRAQVLIGMIEGESCHNLIAVIRAARSFEIATVASLAGLESAASCYLPDVVVLSEEILGAEDSLAKATRRLAAFAPVIVLATPERQMELVGLVISGQVDLVTLSDGFASVAAAFIERRLNSPNGYSREFRSAWSADVPSDFAEILRHEINNPLTGILGNAELLLSQLREKLPAISVQRLETVIDLAVRLRETVRCLAAEPRSRESSAHSL